MNVLVEAEVNRFGDLEVVPVNRRFARQIERHLKEMGVLQGAGLYIQSDWEVDEFIDEFVPKRKRNELRQGWPVRFLMDRWTYLVHVGWDASEAV